MRSDAKVLEILADIEAGLSHKVIAARYGTSISMVSKISSGARYPSVRGTFAAIQLNALLSTLAFTGAA